MEQEIFIFASWSKYSKEMQYSVKDYEPSNGYVLIEKRIITFETPTENELKVRCAAVLRADLQKKRGEHYVMEKALEEEIQELLALEDHSKDVKEEDDIPF